MPTDQERKKRREYARQWRLRNPDYDRERYRKNPAKSAAFCARWRAKNRKKLVQRQQRYVAANPEKEKARRKAYHARTLGRQRVYRAGYREKNRERLRKYGREYMARRCDSDDNFKLRARLRSRIYTALRRKNLSKGHSVLELIGCDIQFLRGYLEARFLKGMTWQNIGKWHVDHHIPLAEFDLRAVPQQKQAFHYSNLRPLWGPQNISKGAKRPASHQAELI